MRAPVVVDSSALRGRDLNTYLAKSVAGSADVTLTGEEMCAGTLEFTGAITASISIIFPLAAEQAGYRWQIKNSVTGSPNLTVTVKQTSQTGVVIDRNVMTAVVSNGTDLTRNAGVGVSQMTRLPRRFSLLWVAGQRGKPGINADIQDASEAVRMIADPDFELLGLNAVSTCSAYSAEGGLTYTTTTGSGDQVIQVPHLDASQSAWGTVTWGTDQQTEWEAHIKTASAITAMTIWTGLKTTNVSVTITDNEQVFFRYAAATNSGKWQAIYSIGGTDVVVDTGVTVVLSTEYHFRITIDASRIARMYLDGALVATSTALANTTDLIPYIGVQTDTTAAKNIRIFSQAISRVFA